MAEGRRSSPVALEATPHFERRAKKLAPAEQRALATALKLFQADPSDPRLRVHKLSGQLEGRWAFSYGHDARVIFLWDGPTAVLLDAGSHDDVYG